jgi:hypothetical protein
MNLLHIVTKLEVFVKNHTWLRSVQDNLYIYLVMNEQNYILSTTSITALVRTFAPRRRRP